MSQSQAAVKLNIPRSTLGKILQRRESLIPGRSQKRARTGQSRQVDAAVMGWLSDVRKRDAPINGPILKAKAKKFAEQPGEDKFTRSEGWFGRFNLATSSFMVRLQRLINLRKMTGLPIGANLPRNTIHRRFGMLMKLAFICVPYLIERL